MNEYFFSGKTVDFEQYPIRIYLETKFSQNQYLSHEFTSNKIEFYSEDQNWSYAKKSETKSYDIFMEIEYDEAILFDGYKLSIDQSKISLKVAHYRGIINGIIHLEKITCNHSLPICTIKEIPSVEYRGIIEGFYGVPWSHQNRLDALDLLRELKMNMYIYAPKDDLYHRQLWKESYPQEQEKKLHELIQKAKKNHLEFVYTISPGNSIDMCNQEDIERVASKLLEVKKYGVTSFALLMDDINYNLSEEEVLMYKTPGNAHGVIANKVYQMLLQKMNVDKFYICPTEYWQKWDTPYRRDLKHSLHSNIDVFFTGYHTIAQSIPKEDLDIAHQSFGHTLAIWDNYPTNDVNKDRLYLGPITNRTRDLNNVSTYLSNPMNQYHLSEFALSTIADYLWNPQGYNESLSIQSVIERFASKWGITVSSARTLYELNESTRLRFVPHTDWKQNIKNKSKKAMTKFVNIKELLREINQLQSTLVYQEIHPWITILSKEIEYYEAYLNNKKMNIEEHKHNLGFNFGTYAQSLLKEAVK